MKKYRFVIVALVFCVTAFSWGAWVAELIDSMNTATTDGCVNDIDGVPKECKDCELCPAGSGGSSGGGPSAGGSPPQGLRPPNPIVAPGGGEDILKITPGDSRVGGNPIDVSHTCKIDKYLDVSVPLSGGLEFRVERIYTSGKFINTRISDTCPMLGVSWHLNLDARLFRMGSSLNIIVLLPTSQPRLFEWEWGVSYNCWRSKAAEGFYGEVTWDSVNEEFELVYPSQDKLYFNEGGFLIRRENAAGVYMTFERELVTINSVQYDRLKKVHAPTSDGRRFEFAYLDDEDYPYLLESITLKTSTDEDYSQELVKYEYYTSEETEDNAYLLHRALYMGENKGKYYKYGSWNNSSESVEMLDSETWMRTLAEIGTYTSTAGENATHCYKYRAGGWNKEGRCGYEPYIEYQAVYSAPDLYTPSSYSVTHSICRAGTGVDPPTYGDLGAVGDSKLTRIYRGDWNSDYIEYTSNEERDLTTLSYSDGYDEMDVQMAWDGDRRAESYAVEPGTANHIYDLTYQSTASGHLGQGNITAKTDILGRTTSIQYHATFNKPTQITDPFNRVTTNAYNATTGLLTSITYPPDPDSNAHTVSYSYNSYMQANQITDSIYGTTYYAYYATGATGATSANNGGWLSTITESNGVTTTFEYNTLGYVTRIEKSDTPTVVNIYDEHRLTEFSVGGISATYYYDDLGNLIMEKNPANLTTTYTYDGIGHLLEVDDAENNAIKYEYNLYNQATKITDPENNETIFGYDGMGRLITEIDELSNTTIYTYGDSGCSCGSAGKITKKVDAEEQTITYDYDSAGRITEINYYATGDEPDVDDPERTVEYEYNHYVNSVQTNMATKITDSALPFTTKYYTFSYDTLNRKAALTHPEGWQEAWLYNSDRLVSFHRDVDVGQSTYSYDAYKRLSQIEDPWGKVTEFTYNTSSDWGPRNALKEITYENDTITQYTYDTLNRIDTITNLASDESVMTSFDYIHDKTGNIQQIALNGDDTWDYQYDKIYQLTAEARLNSSDQVRWSRTYAYDGTGNRDYLYYYDGSTTSTTSYTYNDLNQLVSRSNPNKSWYYDDNGNLMVSTAGLDSYFYWTIDNRMKEASITEGLTQMEYAYDISGSRILKHSVRVGGVTDGTRYRYCFNGLTEEVVKESVDGAHSDTAFEYVEEEDGNSASEWYVYDNVPSGATVSSVADNDRLSYVIKCDGQSGNGFVVGDNGSDSANPNDSPWNETKRVLSFWYKGGFSPIYVGVSTSSGSKFLQYYSGNGTNFLDGGGNVCFYLGSGAAASDWKRFERNIEEDWESVSAASWTNTDGFLIRPTSTASYDFYVDDVRFSNSRTKIHNTLSGDKIGQIVSARNYMSDSYGQPEDVWYSYDHIGNVVNLSNSSGAKSTEYAQDAFGNVLSSATTGAWASSASGRHLTTKEYDDNVDLYYFNARWYDPGIGRFISKDPMFSFANKNVLSKLPYFYTRQFINQYIYCLNNPVNSYDLSGGCNSTDKKNWKEIKKRLAGRGAKEAYRRACCAATDGAGNSANGALHDFCLVWAQELGAPGDQLESWANSIEKQLRKLGWDDENVKKKCSAILKAWDESDKKSKEKKETNETK